MEDEHRYHPFTVAFLPSKNGFAKVMYETRITSQNFGSCHRITFASEVSTSSILVLLVLNKEKCCTKGVISSGFCMKRRYKEE
jgi:hypothetical protein